MLELLHLRKGQEGDGAAEAGDAGMGISAGADVAAGPGHSSPVQLNLTMLFAHGVPMLLCMTWCGVPVDATHVYGCIGAL
jgi:hypothetical protein